jgi:general secretion pathway protein G
MIILPKKGFTLIELLVVMMIIGILAVIGIGSYMNSMARGRDAKRKGDLRQIAQALNMYWADKELYPASATTIQPCFNSGTNCTDFIDTDHPTTIYMKLIPRDTGSRKYFYQTSTDRSQYKLWAQLEVTTDPDWLTTTSPNCTGFSFPTTQCGGPCNFAITSNNTSACSTMP